MVKHCWACESSHFECKACRAERNNERGFTAALARKAAHQPRYPR